MYQKVYILNIVDHYSKFAYSFIQNSKTSKEVLENFKKYLDKFGIPKNVHTDNGGEFINKDFQKFCENKGINLIHWAPRHPQSQGAVEAFNNKFKKLFSVLMQDPNYNCNLNEIVLNINKIYNNSIHSTTKVSPLSAFKNKNSNIKKQIIIKTIKSQKKHNLEGLKKNTKCLLANNIKLNGNVVKALFNKKGPYTIPIVIDEGFGGCEYSFHVDFDISILKKNVTYRANYKLIKKCEINIWDEIKEDLLKDIKNKII